MAKRILFLEKNKLDISMTDVTITASQGEDFVDFMRNRSNTSAWVTSGSVDADNTNFVVDFVNSVDLDFISLVKMNFKNYTVQYWNGSIYTDFSTAISVSNNTSETKYHEFTSVTTTKIKVIITGTMTANEDKYLFQLIATEAVGRLNGWPVIKKPTLSRDKIKTKMLSGKLAIKEQIGAFSVDLEIKILSDSDDLDTIEALYDTNDGFLVWLCGGDETQFSSIRKGYRLEDFYLMKCADEYQPEFYKGVYSAGIATKVSLIEVVD